MIPPSLRYRLRELLAQSPQGPCHLRLRLGGVDGDYEVLDSRGAMFASRLYAHEAELIATVINVLPELLDDLARLERRGEAPDPYPLPGEDGESPRVFKVDVGSGGCVHWIGARSAAEAFLIANEQDAFDGMWSDDGIEIDVVTEQRLGELRFHDEDGKVIPLLEEWQRDRSPRYLACSEW